jgi:hypothetical protein
MQNSQSMKSNEANVVIEDQKAAYTPPKINDLGTASKHIKGVSIRSLEYTPPYVTKFFR